MGHCTAVVLRIWIQARLCLSHRGPAKRPCLELVSDPFIDNEIDSLTTCFLFKDSEDHNAAATDNDGDANDDDDAGGVVMVLRALLLMTVYIPNALSLPRLVFSSR